MPPRNNSKTSKKAAEQSQTVMGGFRKFLQRLCIFGLTLIGMLLVYFLMGGDSKKLTGVSNSGENPANQSAGADGEGVAYSVGKPALDENGNPVYKKVSSDWDIYGSGMDEMMKTGTGSEMGGSSAPETSLDPDLAAELGLPDSGTSESPENHETPEKTDSSPASEGTPMTGNSGSENSGGSSSDYSGGSSYDYSSGSSSGYSGGASYDYSSGSGYSNGSGSDYSSGQAYSGGSSSDSPAGLNTIPDSSGAAVGTSGESLEDFFPKTPPMKNYKRGVVTGPDGRPRCDEVKILEVGRGEPLKNHYGPAVTDFLDLFDFSVTPDWIEANWSNAAIVGPLTTRGYRVPISTGPEPSDLVGSLTYYFNNRLEVEKITFEGYTGDLDRLLISLKYFNLTKRITSDPSALLYLSEPLSDNRRSFLKSYFRLQSRDKAEPNKRYWITMELYPPEK